MQALVFGPLGMLVLAQLLVLGFPEEREPKRCRAWLRDIMGTQREDEQVSDLKRPRVAFGEGTGVRNEAIVVAFSAKGLRRLGLGGMGISENKNDALKSFPLAIIESMNSRSRILGDEGSSPDRWEMGRT